MTAPTVTVTRRFDVPAERVFDAWLDPALIGRWMFGPTVRDEQVDHIGVDARVGGRFSFAVHRQGERVDHVGEYLAIDRPRHLSFSWGVAGTSTSRVEVRIEPAPTGCELTLVHTLDPAWADAAVQAKAGWAFMMETLDREMHPTDGFVHPSADGAVRLTRLLPGPIARVWSHLIDPELRASWLAGGPVSAHVGGPVALAFRHADLSTHKVPTPPEFQHMDGGTTLRGQVTEIESPHRLGFTWGDGPAASHVLFELRAQGTQVRLTVTHSRLDGDGERRSVGGGWHTHVDTLADRLHGREPECFWVRHASLQALYRQREQLG